MQTPLPQHPPASSPQGVIEVAKGQGIAYVWIDW